MLERDESRPIEVSTRTTGRHSPPRILLTNDDGIDSPGLHAMARRLAGDFDVIVVAPDAERSGSGTGIGYFDPTLGVAVASTLVGGCRAFAVAGPPGLAVMSAMLGAWGDVPDLVLSGINPGINTGHSVLHSGTVGAVLTARTFGSDGVAVSLAPSEPWRWETAATLASAVVEWALDRPTTSCTTLNLNVPGVDLAELRGLRWADLDRFGYFRVAATDAPGERLQFEVGSPESGLDPASDTALLADGFATLTPLNSVEPAPFPDAPPPWEP
jgi:5'-nucleotidase